MEFLEEQYPDSPRTRIKKLLKSGIIRINSKPETLYSFPINPGDIVEINHNEVKVTKNALPFPILFDDKYVSVIDKPAGISTSSIDGSRNVQDILSAFLKEGSKGKVRSYVVHRLDKEASGVLLFAKSLDLMETLKENWEKTEKHYYALVEGTPEKEEGTIESWLMEGKLQKVHSTSDTTNAKLAITHYKTIKKLQNYTLLDIVTDTGRKNQIRVHLSEMGHPIVGDRKYGASAEFIRRIRLHAYYLEFPHPVSGEKIIVQSDMPAGFLSLKAHDEKYK